MKKTINELYVVRDIEHSRYLSIKNNNNYIWVSDINEAEKFKSSTSAIDLYSKIPKFDKGKDSILVWKFPCACGIEKNEIPIMQCSFAFEDSYEICDGMSYTGWEVIAIKEIGVQAALKELNRSLNKNEKNPTLFFWKDDDKESFVERRLLGIIRRTKYTASFIASNGDYNFELFPHCGTFRTVDSGYRMPIYDNLGNLIWANAAKCASMIEDKLIDEKQLKPAFKTSLNVEKFMNDVHGKKLDIY